jgi:hypothetical protein
MTPINLYQQSAEEVRSRDKTNLVSGGVIAGALIVLLTLGAYGVLKYMNGNYAKENKVLADKLATQKKELASGDQIDAIADFQKRSNSIVSNISLSEKENMKNIMQLVASNITEGILLDEYSYKEGVVTLVMSSKDYALIAKQVVQLKSVNKFSGVAVSELKKDDKGITFKAEMTYTK